MMKIAAIFRLVLAVAVLDFTTAESPPYIPPPQIHIHKPQVLPAVINPVDPIQVLPAVINPVDPIQVLPPVRPVPGNGLSKVCSRPKAIGPCKRATKRFFFNAKSGNCEKFNFGGCKGNGNNFATRAACKLRCKQGIPKVCSMPSATGKCRGAMKKFYYDVKAKKCKTFLYGGCGGNENRFDSKKECKDKCMD